MYESCLISLHKKKVLLIKLSSAKRILRNKFKVSNFIKIKKIHAQSKLFDTYIKCFDRTSPKKVYNLLFFSYSIYINKIQLLMLDEIIFIYPTCI